MKDALKVAVDAREFLGQRKTGIARHVQNLFSALLSRSTIEPVFLTHNPSWLPACFRRPPATCMQIKDFPTVVADQILIPAAVSRVKAVVFFSPYYKVPLVGNFRKISTVHDVMFLRLPMMRPLRRALALAQLKMAAAKSDLILVDSEFTRTDYLALAPNAEAKTHVLYPGIEESWLAEGPLESADSVRNSFTGGRPYLLYVGNFKPHKNVALLVKAFISLAATNRHMGRCLVLAGGDPTNAPAIEALKNSVPNLILICRDLRDEDLRNLYSAADWTVTLSSYEGFGYTVLEAMARGCPVLYHPCTSLPEIAGEAGMVVPSLTQKAVEQALDAAIHLPPDARKELSGKGYQQAQRFAAHKTADMFLEILASLNLTAK